MVDCGFAQYPGTGPSEGGDRSYGKTRSQGQEGQSRQTTRQQQGASRSGISFAPNFSREPVSGKEQSVAKKQLILDFSEYDLNTVIADIEEIHR